MDHITYFVIVIAVVFYIIHRVLRDSDRDEEKATSDISSSAPDPPHPRQTICAGYTGRSYPFSEIDPDPKLAQIHAIHTKVRGVSHRNADGAAREQIIRQLCQKGDALCFVREPGNPFDRNAVQVRRIVCSDVPDKPRVGEQIGYLSRSMAEEFASRMDDDNFVLMAEILNFSGGDDDECMGVNIQLNVYMPQKRTPQAKKRKPSRGRKRAGDIPA